MFVKPGSHSECYRNHWLASVNGYCPGHGRQWQEDQNLFMIILNPRTKTKQGRKEKAWWNSSVTKITESRLFM